MLYTTINVSRCAILHENDVLKASTLLKFWDYKIPQHITVPLSCERNRFGLHLQLSLQKIQSNDKGSHKTILYCNFVRMQGLFLDSVRFFRCPNFTIVGVNVPIEAEVGFVIPQNVPWPSDVNHHSNTQVQKLYEPLIPVLQ
ncbi:hypothetical protein AVEN_213232-1 [Araneus ventricosus]|uniref:Uncharacterized protein n=1 Tax=Araneus ventricosus TaxID=182803 RepID=A0A4Y2PGU5_ARAVE|nr:hypothetical protein AVEN_213232-1 [Araneus ventricosus]